MKTEDLPELTITEEIIDLDLKMQPKQNKELTGKHVMLLYKEIREKTSPLLAAQRAKIANYCLSLEEKFGDGAGTKIDKGYLQDLIKELKSLNYLEGIKKAEVMPDIHKKEIITYETNEDLRTVTDYIISRLKTITNLVKDKPEMHGWPVKSENSNINSIGGILFVSMTIGREIKRVNKINLYSHSQVYHALSYAMD
ncbi:MAG: hypothetical protein Kapaf2KO_23960 [Candidatus Kapaibacteriales bacterium]